MITSLNFAYSTGWRYEIFLHHADFMASTKSAYKNNFDNLAIKLYLKYFSVKKKCIHVKRFLGFCQGLTTRGMGDPLNF